MSSLLSGDRSAVMSLVGSFQNLLKSNGEFTTTNPWLGVLLLEEVSVRCRISL